MKRFIVVVVVLLVLSGCVNSDRIIGLGDWPDDQPRRILFIGNSHTYSGGGVNWHLLGLIKSAHPDWDIDVRAITVGGHTLEKHYNMVTVESIRRGFWDVVILQENSHVSAYDPEKFYRYARLFDEAIRLCNACACFYMVHPWYHDSDMFNNTVAHYTSIAAELDESLAPAGVAWEMAREQAPYLQFYDSDKYHPNVAGAYLSACVIYATLYGVSPEGLAARPRQVSAEDAATIQSIAWQAVQNYILTREIQ